MKLSTFLAAIGLASFVFTSCTTNSNSSSTDRFDVGGVPEWIIDGGKLSDEPAPRKPDNASIPYQRESGPVSFTFITDDDPYPTPPEKRASRKHSEDVLERGRDYRIKRLFR